MNATPIEIQWNPDVSIFASEAFLRTVSPRYGWLGGFDDGNQLRCALPYTVIRKAGLSLARFPVQTIAMQELTIEQERRFLNAAVKALEALGVDVIVPATFNTVFRTCPDQAISAPFGSFRIDLTIGEEALWKRVHNKHRNVIRNAEKKGVVIKTGPQHLRTAFELTRLSFERSASGPLGRLRVRARLDYETFRSQIQSLGDNAMVFVAEHDGVPQGAAVIPFSRHAAYYMHGGSADSPLTGSANLMQWEIIKRFSGMGVRAYDFFGARVNPDAGSKIEGIMRFKERFGGEFVRGYMWKMPCRPFKYRLYHLAAAIRNGGDVVDQERGRLGYAALTPPVETGSHASSVS
jgi:hypothetical protein